MSKVTDPQRRRAEEARTLADELTDAEAKREPPTTWNVGIGITKSVFTLDLRYYDTNYSKSDCNAFTSDHTARFSGDFTGINPGGFGSTWCSATFVATGKFDLTAMANLK